MTGRGRRLGEVDDEVEAVSERSERTSRLSSLRERRLGAAREEAS
jgi:hypothetical protein